MIKNEKARQIYRFTMFSISAGIIQLLVFTILFELAQFPYWASYIIGLVSLVLWNTTFNRKYTFKSTIPMKTALSKLAIFYLFFIPPSTWAGEGLVYLDWNEYLVLILTMIINLALAFLYNKHFIYNGKINTIE